MFLAWMEANQEYDMGRSLTYAQFPSMFTYDSNEKQWHPRQRGQSVGRLTFVPPSTRELYYMRLLLNVQVGCTSFEDIRTVNGIVFNTYREACGALHLLADDREYIELIKEVANIASGRTVRKLFANLLVSMSMSDPLKVWESTWEILVDGILYTRRQSLNLPGLFIFV